MRSLLLGSLLIVALAHDASANGRPAGTSTITFQKGRETTIVAGMTFGVLISKDNGVTWDWMCEEAIGYGGIYDPDFAATAAGSVFATTFDGLKVMRDGCTFATTPFGTKFVSVTTVGPDGALYAAVTDAKTDTNPGDARIYRSNDDGVTFPVVGAPGIVNDWWESIEVAPSNAERVYLTGYRFIPNPGGGGNIRVQLMRRSNDGGVTWTELATGGLPTMPNSTIQIVSISPTDPDVVYARVTLEDNNTRDALYRSDNGGVAWTKLTTKMNPMSMLRRANGDLVVASPNDGADVSTNNGMTWTPLVNPPHIRCLVENSAGEVWACTANFGTPQVPADGFGVMKTTDLATWTGVMKYQQINQPVACDPGTVQHDRCDRNPNFDIWCGLCIQFGCDPKRTCAGPADAAPEDKPGCCQSGGDAPAGALLLGCGVALVALRTRRRRPA